ncbi:MAG TPA: hypothetical protein DD723_06870 [Candidatus Omnitrophica bacterium]|uniref:Uncharacterized protein n=1 Tax=Candidatus Kaiserbacteria bacterium GW2011_GWA2_49_19 TaxID=1618669 RepID=A0A0G1YRG0_9BACT|nr:MAG: hypothetical protein UY44_C0006G0014 [Candidatus Kaiserbacteria bacterium GW2011_GWA2_49_19]OGX21729.1 MAG: hypothetical protein A2Y04_06250 [Omnitrophica WOR_2 bacterium GWC2_45_7]HBR15246.1 hypothetical protein [Candidatus Omnitrophota bacterium]
MKRFKSFFIFALIGLLAYFFYARVVHYIQENAVLKQVIARLEADSRTAEVLVTGVNFDEKTRKTYTTIKFLEYDVKGQPMEPKYFTFSGNIIQFQSLVIRFDDIHIRSADKFKGKSAYLFWKIFMLDGPNTREYEITPVHQVPHGYRVQGGRGVFEEKLWINFWKYALNPKAAEKSGIKSAQIEAPGTLFIPGVLYMIKIEHDGGLRIDSTPLSPILKGEKIPG